MKENGQNFTLKMNTCMILLKNIEYVMKVSTNTWKNIYKLHKPSDFFVHVNEKDDDDDEEEDVEKKGDEVDDINLDDEEEEWEATRGSLLDIQSIEETDVEKIVAAVMTSSPHFLRKSLVQYGSEKALTKLVVVTTATLSTQPSSGHV